MVVASALPHILVSPAPPDEPLAEPFSPFAWSTTHHEDEDSFRPKHLTPPPTHLRFSKQSSPLRPAKGLERDRFEALLKASRERNAANGAAKPSSLRKELAVKVHLNKQAERRALFLSKVLAPPSPTATSLPKTPPESPAIFHYTLPSPGLVSPLALFESLNDKDGKENVCQPWVEQVDFHIPGKLPNIPNNNRSQGKSLPSLDQISARLSYSRTTNVDIGERTARLPPFLTQHRQVKERPRLSIGVGRLKMPIRSAEVFKPEPPPSPVSPVVPNLQITTTVVPRSSSSSPTELSESNLLALTSRQRRAHDMLSTLRRRMLPSDMGLNGREPNESEGDKRFRRQSAPADLFSRPRSGFEHPVLALPGAF